MVPPKFQELVERNKKHAASHSPLPTIQELVADATVLGKNPLIVTCLDPRVMPQSIFKLEPVEAFICRTVCGHPQHVLRDIVAIDEEAHFPFMILMHHTECGALTYTDEHVRGKLKERLPQHLHREVDQMQYGGIADSGSVEEDVKKDAAWVRGNEIIRKELRANVYGCVYNIKTGVVEFVDMPSH